MIVTLFRIKRSKVNLFSFRHRSHNISAFDRGYSMAPDHRPVEYAGSRAPGACDLSVVLSPACVGCLSTQPATLSPSLLTLSLKTKTLHLVQAQAPMSTYSTRCCKILNSTLKLVTIQKIMKFRPTVPVNVYITH